MDIMSYICLPFGYLMKWCFMLITNYGLAIILFTLATKLVLMPLSVWIQKNSILMVKIQPEVNFLKARLMGNADAIAEEQSKLFKKEHYHPMLSIIPLVIQIVLLLGVVEIIYHPLSYLLAIDNSVLTAMAEYLSLDLSSSEWQIAIIDAVKNGTITMESNISGLTPEIIAEISSFKTGFLGIDLCAIPMEVLGVYFLVPVLAGASSWLLSFTQNISNVLQHEQGKVNKYGLMIFSVGLSLYLGFFVPSGIALYWVASNVLAVGQMYLLNAIINPKKYVDYEALEQSRVELDKAKAFGAVDKKSADYKENKKREKEDYKKFKKVVNKHIVIYSEKSGFYKYFKGIIEQIIERSNLNIHYVTNDPNDVIFEIAKTEPRIRPYYIGLKKVVVLMMMVETKMFIMTTPDLDKYYLKRSFIKKDTEYVYIPHDMMSVHMSFREGAFDAFDTIFCAGPHVKEEMRALEKEYGLKNKTLVEFGYPLADELVKAGEKANKEKKEGALKEILIAPSWQEDNLLDCCIDTLIEKLYCKDYHITIRPHPEYAKRYGSQLDALVKKYADKDNKHLTFELDFSVNKSVYTSDIIITDWSGIGPEFCIATKKPAIFINTKMKCPNPNYTRIPQVPVEISLRDELGVSVEKEEVVNIAQIVADVLSRPEDFEKKITDRFKTFIYNQNNASKVGADYIFTSLLKKKARIDKKKTKENLTANEQIKE